MKAIPLLPSSIILFIFIGCGTVQKNTDLNEAFYFNIPVGRSFYFEMVPYPIPSSDVFLFQPISVNTTISYEANSSLGDNYYNMIITRNMIMSHLPDYVFVNTGNLLLRLVKEGVLVIDESTLKDRGYYIKNPPVVGLSWKSSWDNVAFGFPLNSTPDEKEVFIEEITTYNFSGTDYECAKVGLVDSDNASLPLYYINKELFYLRGNLFSYLVSGNWKDYDEVFVREL